MSQQKNNSTAANLNCKLNEDVESDQFVNTLLTLKSSKKSNISINNNSPNNNQDLVINPKTDEQRQELTDNLFDTIFDTRPVIEGGNLELLEKHSLITHNFHREGALDVLIDKPLKPPKPPVRRNLYPTFKLYSLITIVNILLSPKKKTKKIDMSEEQRKYNNRLKELLFSLTGMKIRVKFEKEYKKEIKRDIKRDMYRTKGKKQLDSTIFGHLGHFPSMQYLLYCLLDDTTCHYKNMSPVPLGGLPAIQGPEEPLANSTPSNASVRVPSPSPSPIPIAENVAQPIAENVAQPIPPGLPPAGASPAEVSPVGATIPPFTMEFTDNLLRIHNIIHKNKHFNFKNAAYIDGMNIIRHSTILQQLNKSIISEISQPFRYNNLDQKPNQVFNLQRLYNLFTTHPYTNYNFVISLQKHIYTEFQKKMSMFLPIIDNAQHIYFIQSKNIMFIVTPGPRDMDIHGVNRFLVGPTRKCELDDYILVYLCKFYREFEADTYLITQDRMKWLMNSGFKRGMIDPSPQRGFKRICSIPSSKRRNKLPIIGKSKTRDPLKRPGGGKEKIKRTTKKKSLRKNSKRGGKRKSRRTRRTRKSRQSKRRTKKN